MSATREDVLKSAMELSDADRFLLATELLETFPDYVPGGSPTAPPSLPESRQPFDSQNAASTTEEWSDEKNERRCNLIDKEITGAITVEERIELNQLQRQAMAYRDRMAPLPMAGAVRLHAELVGKKNGIR